MAAQAPPETVEYANANALAGRTDKPSSSQDQTHNEIHGTLFRDQFQQDIDVKDIRRDGNLVDFPSAIRSGLKEPHYLGHRTFPSLLLWNEQGLKYFEEVTYCPEYYLTNTEIGLLESHSQDIAKNIKSGSILLELGSGCLRKIEILLKAIDGLGKTVDYYALDLDSNELERTLKELRPDRFRHVRCHGLLGTYDDGHAWLSKPENPHKPKCVLSLGSTMGSFLRDEAADFWSNWASVLRRRGTPIEEEEGSVDWRDGQIIIGLDASKDSDKVWHAYNDEGGANRRFIANVLEHANDALGYQAFNHNQWVVEGQWDAEGGRHDQYLVPLEDVEFEGVRLGKRERIFVVHSHKYGEEGRIALWDAAGLQEQGRYENDDCLYGEFIAVTALPLT
jgi:EasF-like predicted methyltransferase